MAEDGVGSAAAALLAMLRVEVWPLLDARGLISKADREAILGYDPKTGV